MFIYPMIYPMSPIPPTTSEPPTIYAILNAYCNFGKESKTLTKNLANVGRQAIFDFSYPIPEDRKESFETNVLNHFLMRRIGYDTVASFKIALNVKLNEIMPNYVKLYNATKDWDIFDSGETTIRSQETQASRDDNITSTSSSNNISDRRHSDTPQSELTDVQNGSYVNDYNYDRDNNDASATSKQNTNDNGKISENIDRNYKDKSDLYSKFLQSKQNIYTMIFKDLEELFYQIVD